MNYTDSFQKLIRHMSGFFILDSKYLIRFLSILHKKGGVYANKHRLKIIIYINLFMIHFNFL